MDDYFRADAPSRTAFPMARAGYPFLYAAAFATAVLALLGMKAAALAGLLASFCICGFFRDPDRVVPAGAGVVVSPADGRVVSVGRVESTPFFDGACTRVGIFMSVFDVHVNRIPHEGRIRSIAYRPGRFQRANLESASTRNEHSAVTLQTAGGHDICFVQIAGLIARRIISWLQVDQSVGRGERFGLICFGSRVDVYLPADTRVEVAPGSRVKGGTSILGYLPEAQTP